MLKIVIVSLIVIGIFLVICGLTFKPLKITAGFRKRKASTKYTPLSILESISAKGIIKKLLDYISHDKELWINKLFLRIIELSEIGLSLQQMYLLKFFCISLCAIIVTGVCYTNTIYQTKQFVAYSGEEKSTLYHDSSYDQSRYLLYKQIISRVGKSKFSHASDTEKYYIAEEEIAKCLNSSDQNLITQKTDWFIKTWREVQNIKAIKGYHILIILLAFFIPEVLMTFRWLLRGCVYKKEIVKLEYIFELLARVDGLKTLDIIFELEKSSKIYSKYLHEFATMFQYDKQSGFDYLKSRNIKSLSKLVNVLEIYSLADKDLALEILEREVMERDESIIITADETIDFIDLIAFLSIVPLAYELARLMLNPMLDIVYKAFEFI